MQEIIKLYEWFDDYTKKLVGQLYYEENLKNGKSIKKAHETLINRAINGTLQ